MGFGIIVFLFILFVIISLAVKGGRSGSHSNRPQNHTNMWSGDQQRSLDSSTTDFSTHDSGSHTHHHHHGHHDHSHHGGHHGGHDSGGFGGGDAGGGGHH